MEAWLQEFVEKIIASEARGIAAQQVTYESVEAFSEDAGEAAMSRYLTEIAEQTLKEEQELVQTSSDLTSVFIDNEIKLLASEELKSYIYQVECSNAIGQRLHELANEMVEE